MLNPQRVPRLEQVPHLTFPTRGGVPCRGHCAGGAAVAVHCVVRAAGGCGLGIRGSGPPNTHTVSVEHTSSHV